MSTVTFAKRLAPVLLLIGLALPAAATEYTIDPEHTYAGFAIDHLGFSTLRGRFTQTTGSIDFDPASRQGEIYIRIAAASLDTGLKLRDDTLRGPHWFNVADNPDILFRSKRLSFDGDRLTGVDGSLVMHGEIRPLHLNVSRFKCGFNLVIRKRGCGADAHATLRRSDYGISDLIPFVGDEVRLDIEVEAYAP